MRLIRAGLAAILFLPWPAAGATLTKTNMGVTLLQKSVARVEHSRSLQTESDIAIQGTGQGMTTVFREHVKFRRLSPGRFRSDVTLLTRYGKPSDFYTIISDGTTVWTIARAAGQYAVMPLTEYRQSYNLGHHIAALGLFGAMVIGSEDPRNDLLGHLSELASAQTGRTVRLDLGGGTGVRFLVDAPTRQFQELEFDKKNPQMTFTMTEKMEKQDFAPKLDLKQFGFTPPTGAKRVPSINIGLLP